jgi:hypothetical protein
LSRVMTWVTFATESFGRPVIRELRSKLPGAFAHRRFVVRRTHTTVPMRLWFSLSPWTTTKGLRNPGSEPLGIGRSAHQISPCETTTRLPRVCDAQRRERTHRPAPPHRTPCSSLL